MIPFLTEIVELAVAALMLSMAIPVFKKSNNIPDEYIVYAEAK